MIDIPDEKVINSSRDDSDTPDTTYHTIDERGPLVPTSFTSYSEFVRWYKNKEPHLYDQREILAAIVFEEGATKLPTLVNPKEFDYRGPSDWQENPGGYERIAVVAFDYWEDHGKPPEHDIADLMEGDEQALNYLYDLETVWARAIDLEARARRGAWARRLRDLISDHISDLGGEDALSTAERVLVRRAAMLCLQAELMESRFANNEHGEASAKQIETYQRVTNTLRRTLEALGLHRRPKDVNPPSLKQYLRGRTIDAEDDEVHR